MSKSIFVSNDQEQGMVAHYKDRLSLLVRIDVLERMEGFDKLEEDAHWRGRGSARGNGQKAATASKKSRQATHLLAGLKKRLRDMDSVA